VSEKMTTSDPSTGEIVRALRDAPNYNGMAGTTTTVEDIEYAARYNCGICGVCAHHDKMWAGSGCNLTNNGEQCNFAWRGAREGEGNANRSNCL
jgi:hypothetical protein